MHTCCFPVCAPPIFLSCSLPDSKAGMGHQRLQLVCGFLSSQDQSPELLKPATLIILPSCSKSRNLYSVDKHSEGGIHFTRWIATYLPSNAVRSLPEELRPGRRNTSRWRTPWDRVALTFTDYKVILNYHPRQNLEQLIKPDVKQWNSIPLLTTNRHAVWSFLIGR